MAVELGRTWCGRHGHLRFARLFRPQRRSSNQCLIGMLAWVGAHMCSLTLYLACFDFFISKIERTAPFLDENQSLKLNFLCISRNKIKKSKFNLASFSIIRALTTAVNTPFEAKF